VSDGPYKTLPMKPRWKTAAKFAYVQAFSVSEIAEALHRAADLDCRGEMSARFINEITGIVRARLGLFVDQQLADLDAMHRRCASTVEASFLRNVIDALVDGHQGNDALNRAAEYTVSDRLLAGYRQVEEHMHREASDERSRAVRLRLEEAHRQIEISTIAQNLLRAGAAPLKAASAVYASVDDGVEF